MKSIINFIKEIFMINQDEMHVGLSQFRNTTVTPVKKDLSIKNKDVKLSDLMRRAS